MPVSFIFLKFTFQNKTTLEASDKPFKLFCFLFLRDLGRETVRRESAMDIVPGLPLQSKGEHQQPEAFGPQQSLLPPQQTPGPFP